MILGGTEFTGLQNLICSKSLNIRREISLKLKPAKFIFSTFKLTSIYTNFKAHLTNFNLETITPSLNISMSNSYSAPSN